MHAPYKGEWLISLMGERRVALLPEASKELRLFAGLGQERMLILSCLGIWWIAGANSVFSVANIASKEQNKTSSVIKNKHRTIKHMFTSINPAVARQKRNVMWVKLCGERNR